MPIAVGWTRGRRRCRLARDKGRRGEMDGSPPTHQPPPVQLTGLGAFGLFFSFVDTQVPILQ